MLVKLRFGQDVKLVKRSACVVLERPRIFQMWRSVTHDGTYTVETLGIEDGANGVSHRDHCELHLVKDKIWFCLKSSCYTLW